MNLLEILFLVLSIFIFVVGLPANYISALYPDIVLQLFHYGRANIKNGKLAIIQSIEVPKRWFAHFYFHAVFFQFAIIVAIIRLYCFKVQDELLLYLLSLTGPRLLTVNSSITIMAASMFLFHLCRRLFETLHVCIYSNTKMNVLHYLLGYIHYTGSILCIVAHSPSLASVFDSTEFKGYDNQLGVMEIAGIIIFFVANYLQHRAHVGLASLRKGKDKKAANSHSIPRGELFEYISCPNYYAEILVYCGLALLFGLNNSSWNCCTIWVISNQIIAGIMNHLWYIKTFPDYPKQRKAIIPFIW